MPQMNPDTETPAPEPEQSIVDTILDLNAFLSGDVRRAEKLARFCTRPDLEADLDALDAELERLTDRQGRPVGRADESLADGGRTARTVALEREAVAREMQDSMRAVRMRQLPSDDWDAFEARHKAVIRNPEAERIEMFNELVTLTAVAPEISAAQLKQLRAKLGPPVIAALHQTAWDVNNTSGVSVPKSSSSSAVLRLAGREKS